jgi:hypothetical protein
MGLEFGRGLGLPVALGIQNGGIVSAKRFWEQVFVLYLIDIFDMRVLAPKQIGL